MGMTSERLEFEKDNLYRYTPLPQYGEDMCKKELVMTKEVFIECYSRWIMEVRKKIGMTVGDLIRNMSDEELAQMMIDIAYENTPIEDGETYMRIPSPIGGYLVDGVIDFHDTDVVAGALQEEV